MELGDGLNVLVGDNEAGKSTLLHAIDLCLTGRQLGRSILEALNVHWINTGAVADYLQQLKSDKTAAPPEILIEASLSGDPDLASLAGTNHSKATDVAGIRLRLFLDPECAEEYQAFVAADVVDTVPVEFYTYEWFDFAGNAIPPHRKRPYSSVLIDPRVIRLQTGTDYYLRDVLQGSLSPQERAQLALTYRQSRREVGASESLTALNEKVGKSAATLTNKQISLALDETAATSWEASLVPHLDEVPISQAGQGEQSALKITMAMLRQDKAGVLLVEEPENHLSHARLNALLGKIQIEAQKRQVVVATHSSFVLNKLDIGTLKLLNRDRYATLSDLSPGTRDYFRKLAGYDTLRLVCCRACILVEGPSDELLVQRAYFSRYQRLPLQDAIEVIAVQALAFRRFLEIAEQLGRRTAVVTDNDGNDPEAVRQRYLTSATSHGEDGEEGSSNLAVFPGDADGGPSLEDQVVHAAGVPVINAILGKKYTHADDLIKHMKDNKTDVALQLLDTTAIFSMPQYIESAIEFVREQ
jgi:putative ATP-dependent endonuclease of OLD family